MNRRLAGLLALLVLVPGAYISLRDFQAGTARLWISGGIVPFKANRAESPRFFWAFTAINAILATGLIAVCAALVIAP